MRLLDRLALALTISAALLGGLAISTPATADSSRLVPLLPRQAPVFLEPAPPVVSPADAKDGALARLILPAEVLTACRPDLSDLRLFDPQGREIPFLLDRGPAPATRRTLEETFEPEILETERTTLDREDGPPVYRERYLLSAPPVPDPDDAEPGSWDLVIETPVESFVRRLAVRVLRETGPLELMDDHALFRLEDPSRERVRFPLSAWAPAPGDLLEVSIEGEEDGYLSPRLRLERSQPLEDIRRVRIPLETIERRAETRSPGGRQTVIELRRPRGLIPESLELQTEASGFARPVTVWDGGPGHREGVLGRGTVYRVRAVGEQQEIPLLLPPAGDHLRVVIEDADGPALDDLQVVAVVRGPALIFEPPSGASPVDASPGSAIATLRFGGGRVHRPQYGLARFAPDLPATGLAARRALPFYDPDRLRTARLGEVGENPDFDGRPALAFAMRPGASLDPAPYRYQRPLDPFTAEPSPEGLYHLPLALDDLAEAQPDLADLRLVDAEDHQWAYLLDPGGDETIEPLEIQTLDTEDGRSRIRLVPPVAPATVSRLVLHSPQPFFDREFRLTGHRNEDDDAGVVLDRGRLVRRAEDLQAPRALEIGFAPTRLHHLELEVVDGDDAPLPWTRAEARFPAPRLYFVAEPAESYRLLLGEPEADPPRYELERVREVVLAVESRPVQTGPLEDNPDFRRGARLGSSKGLQTLALWGVLGLAVVLLAWLTLKLARQED